MKGNHPLNSALLLIEFQNEWLSPQGKLYHLMEDKPQFIRSQQQAQKILVATRQSNRPIIHSGLSFAPNHPELGKAISGLRAGIAAHQTFVRGTEGPLFPTPFTPQDNEFLVSGRTGSSAFSGSNLDVYLRNNGISHLYIMGYALHVCVESTLRAAHDLGYSTSIITDACAAFTQAQNDYFRQHVLHHFGDEILTDDYIKQLG